MLEFSQPTRPVAAGNRAAVAVGIAHVAGRLINRLLAPVGLMVTRNAPALGPCDLRAVTGDPIEGAYHARDRPFVIDVALQSCRAFEVTPFACTEEAHPYVETLVAYRRGDCHAYGDSPLRSYYESWRPANAAEALDIDPKQAHPALRNAPALGAVMPWEDKDPNAWMALYFKSCLVNPAALLTGGAVDLVRRDDHHGPRLWIQDPYRRHRVAIEHCETRESIGEIDFTRLTRIYESIRCNGYQRSNRSDGDIRGYTLRCRSASRILVDGGGNHRIAALAALGYEHVPIRLRPFIIRRDDVASWPNVRSGLFTQEQALAVFDRIFDGRQPEGCTWMAPSEQAP